MGTQGAPASRSEREIDRVKASPEQRMCALLRTELGVDIHPTAMRIFLRVNWKAVSAYAHAVHDGKTEVDAL